ncbi:hypothetical protein [Ramlibacter sp.]|uniref:hypothetical protein n=1 Tax=Ramlibacter sp. TaxID=1917967 RepID=UPI002D34AD21|nr:hypothetical protein [Ramlibacter sp.]HYD75327.1 hypothetical protein [Ramlibacter sp.]
MALDARLRRRIGESRRDGDRFVLVPHVVMDSAAFQDLGYPARSLLLEIARQYSGHNNGQLMISRKRLGDRGWNSVDVIARAKQQLLDGGFIFETVKGQRPNRASWYALTWLKLDHHPHYDAGVELLFRRGAYAKTPRLMENAKPCPAPGHMDRAIAPDGGQQGRAIGPATGAVETLGEAAP